MYSLPLLILSIIQHFALLPPTVLSPTPHGIFQYYGFDQNDSDKILPLTLVRRGVYKIEEEDIGYNDGKEDVGKSYYNLSVAGNGDSVIIEEVRQVILYERFLLSRKTDRFIKREASLFN